MAKFRKEDFVKRFGMTEESGASESEGAQASSGLAAEALETAYRSLGRLVLREIRKSQPNEAALQDIVMAISVPIDELLPVVRWMDESGYVRIIDRPLNGNWKLAATEKAGELQAG